MAPVRREVRPPVLSLSQLDRAQMWVKFVMQSGSVARARRAKGRVSARRRTAFTNAPGALLAPQRGQPEWLSVPMKPSCEPQA